eukprot:CAMPEP_0196816340 /NCGR_PEP_ID=MMETSP1362-20130617/54782_1 /TAXON_ID=163516 /ORGANISM="Leptocylindrus danicus, Strain CCMP1856" /LENGTH=379 /DNA_ID=CAMNT_0042193627 /DNA_START=275 /DNA_END=1414 /DNA_ORIENTATION=-
MYDYAIIKSPIQNAGLATVAACTSNNEKEADAAIKNSSKKSSSSFGRLFRKSRRTCNSSKTAKKDQDNTVGSTNTSTNTAGAGSNVRMTDKQALDVLLSAERIEEVVGMMMEYPLSAAVQGRACHRLIDLSHSSRHAEDNDEQQESLVRDIGGVRLIVAAMRNFADSEYVQKCACWALYCFSYKSQLNRHEIISVSGINAIMASIKGHGNNENILVSAFGALQNLAYRNDKAKKAMYDTGAGVVSLATKTIGHIDSEYVIESAIRFLTEFYDSNHFVDFKSEKDVVPILLQVMKDFPSSKCFHLAYAALINLGVIDELSEGQFVDEDEVYDKKADCNKPPAEPTMLSEVFEKIQSTTLFDNMNRIFDIDEKFMFGKAGR